MLTPELQQYITQSRQQGMTDDQIRQNLVGQGWKESDIQDGFVQKSSRKTPTVILIVLGCLMLPLVFIVFILGGAFMGDTSAGATQSLLSMGAGILYPILLIILSIVSWRRRAIWPLLLLLLLYVTPVVYLFSHILSQRYHTPTPTSQGLSSTSSGQKICGDFPKNANGIKLVQNGNSGSSSTFIQDFPLYPGGTILGRSSSGIELLICSSDDIATILNYYKTLPPSWNISFNGYLGKEFYSAPNYPLKAFYGFDSIGIVRTTQIPDRKYIVNVYIGNAGNGKTIIGYFGDFNL